MAYNAIGSSEVDADSPADATLWGKVKSNFDFLKALFDISTGHTHDGSTADDGPLIATVADGGITQAKLSTAQGEVSATTANQYLTLPGGEYGFYPQTKKTAGATGQVQIVDSIASIGTSYVTNITLDESGSGTIFAQQRYIQASPPYMLGDTEWGHFLFLLRKLGTGEVVSTYQAEDPPWAYNGKVWLPKDHQDRITEVPHPFVNYWDKNPATEGLEIVLVNLSSVDVAKWRTDNEKIGKSILEDLGSVLTGIGVQRAWSNYAVPTIERFTDRVKVITP